MSDTCREADTIKYSKMLSPPFRGTSCVALVTQKFSGLKITCKQTHRISSRSFDLIKCIEMSSLFEHTYNNLARSRHVMGTYLINGCVTHALLVTPLRASSLMSTASANPSELLAASLAALSKSAYQAVNTYTICTRTPT